MIIKNDSLFGYFKQEKQWKKWNEEWTTSTLQYEDYFTRLQETELSMFSDVLFEDDEYFIFTIDAGEFGSSIHFQNKITEKQYAMDIASPNFVFKDSSGYIINGNLAHMDGFVEIVRIANPKDLFRIPDSLNILLNDSVRNFGAYMKYCEFEILPDTIVTKLKDGRNFDFKTYELSKKIISEKLKVKEILDTTGMLSFSTLKIDNSTVHFLDDTIMYLGFVHNDSIYKIDDLYSEHFFTYYYSTQTFNKTILMAFSYWQRKYKKEKMICLIMDGNTLKRYNIK